MTNEALGATCRRTATRLYAQLQGHERKGTEATGASRIEYLHRTPRAWARLDLDELRRLSVRLQTPVGLHSCKV